MKYLINLLIIGLIISLYGCDQKSTEGLEEITSKTDVSKGYSDVFLKIIEDKKTDSSHIYVAKGLFNKKTVGLKFEVKSNMPNGISAGGRVDSRGAFILNAIKIKSIGEESDEFVKAIAQLYSFPTTKGFTQKPLVVTAFSLNEKIANLDKPDYYKFKLFLEEEMEEEYAELYFNINTKDQIIELNEKDNSYRKPITRVFTH